MFGMNPISLYAIIFLVFSNLLTGAGWWIASMRSDNEQQHAEIAEHKLQLFADRVREEGAKAERKTAELIATAKNISVAKDAEYAKNLDRLRTDYQRMRQQYAASSGGVVMPAVPESAKSIDAIPADCLPLAADAAETTLMLESLQGWVKEQEQADG